MTDSASAPDYDFECDLDVRYSDLDTVGIVNNAVYVTLLEEARTRFLRSELGVDAESTDQVLAHLDVDFERPVSGQDSVTARLRVTDVGTASYTLQYELAWRGDRVATAETVQVVVDREGNPRPVPDDWRDAMLDAPDATV